MEEEEQEKGRQGGVASMVVLGCVGVLPLLHVGKSAHTDPKGVVEENEAFLRHYFATQAFGDRRTKGRR